LPIALFASRPGRRIDLLLFATLLLGSLYLALVWRIHDHAQSSA